MRVLDLYCGEGGAGMGYCAAGADVVGVDLKPQRRYPFAFLQADVLSLDVRFLRFFDLIHASPPCQFGTALRHAPNAKGAAGHANLIPATRALLKASGVPYVIENVEAVAPHLVNPICLCGSHFGLGARTSDGIFHQLRRHRLFEASFDLKAPRACLHMEPVIGVYGGHVRNRSAGAGGRGTRDFVGEDKPALARAAMGMPWATMKGISEAIPPAYARWIGDSYRMGLDLHADELQALTWRAA